MIVWGAEDVVEDVEEVLLREPEAQLSDLPDSCFRYRALRETFIDFTAQWLDFMLYPFNQFLSQTRYHPEKAFLERKTGGGVAREGDRFGDDWHPNVKTLTK